MNAEWLDLVAALTVVALAGWSLVRSVRAPAGCDSCPATEDDAHANRRGVTIPVEGLKIGRR